MTGFHIDLLSIIQIGGIFISGLGGLLATFLETRETIEIKKGKNKPHKTHRTQFTTAGKLAFTLILSGIFLGCVGQILANNESKSDTDKLLGNTSDSLGKLEIQSSNTAAILSELSVQTTQNRAVSKTLNDSITILHKINSPINERLLMAGEFALTDTNQLPEVAGNVAGLINFLDSFIKNSKGQIYAPYYNPLSDWNGWLVSSQPYETTLGPPFYVFPIRYLLNNVSDNPKEVSVKNYLNYLSQPDLDLFFYYTNSYKMPDGSWGHNTLCLASTYEKQITNDVFIRYEPSSKKAALIFTYVFSKSDLEIINYNSISMGDVYGIPCEVDLHSYHRSLVRPIQLVLEFDKYPTIDIRDFHQGNHFTFPTQDHIGDFNIPDAPRRLEAEPTSSNDSTLHISIVTQPN